MPASDRESTMEPRDRRPAGDAAATERPLDLDIGGVALAGDLGIPAQPSCLVVFAHGSGSSRHSARNRKVAARLQQDHVATLLFDLLTEDEADDRQRVFDIPLLAERLAATVEQVGDHDTEVASLPVGLFGASTGAAAALDAAAMLPERVGAVVSRGGRPDLSARATEVTVPVLLVVGGQDHAVLDLNHEAARVLGGPVDVVVVEGAGHLFEGPGQLDEVADHAAAWFSRHL
jgi:putative phosphoribosyl transferase